MGQGCTVYAHPLPWLKGVHDLVYNGPCVPGPRSTS